MNFKFFDSTDGKHGVTPCGWTESMLANCIVKLAMKMDIPHIIREKICVTGLMDFHAQLITGEIRLAMMSRCNFGSA